MRIKRVQLQNFLGTKSADYSVDKDIVSVYGRNWSGKSTIISAITYALYGIIMEKSQVKGAINNESWDPAPILSAVISFNHNGKDYILERSTGKVLKLNGETITQDSIDILFGRKESVLCSMIVWNFMKFNIGERFEILNSLIPFESAPIYVELMGKELANEFPLGSITHEQAKARLKTAQAEVSQIQQQLTMKSAAYNELELAQFNVRDDLTDEVVSIKRKSLDEHELTKPVWVRSDAHNINELNEYRSSLAILEKEYKDLLLNPPSDSEVKRLITLYNQKKQQLDAVNAADMCTCCRRPFSPKEKEDNIAIINSDISVLAEEMRSTKPDYENAVNEFNIRKQKLEEDIAAKKNHIDALTTSTNSGKDVLHEEYITKLDAWQEAHNKLRDDLANYVAQLNSNNSERLRRDQNMERKEELKRDIKEHQDKLASMDLGKFEKLVEVLGPKWFDYEVMLRKQEVIKWFFPENVNIVLSEKNATNDNFKKIFTIEQNGIDYNWLSTGMKMVMDMHICDMFNSFTGINVCFVDNCESLTGGVQFVTNPQIFRLIVEDSDFRIDN